jgi:hypothetical protein
MKIFGDSAFRLHQLPPPRIFHESAKRIQLLRTSERKRSNSFFTIW